MCEWVKWEVRVVNWQQQKWWSKEQGSENVDMQRSSSSFQLYNNNNKNVQFVCWFFCLTVCFGRAVQQWQTKRKKTKMKTEKIVMLMIGRNAFWEKASEWMNEIAEVESWKEEREREKSWLDFFIAEQRVSCPFIFRVSRRIQLLLLMMWWMLKFSWRCRRRSGSHNFRQSVSTSISKHSTIQSSIVVILLRLIQTVHWSIQALFSTTGNLISRIDGTFQQQQRAETFRVAADASMIRW